MSEERWLCCESSKGMFETEVTVTFCTGERQVSLFVNNRHVQNAPTRLRVNLIDETEDRGLVRLPSAPLDGPQIVAVRKDQLRAT